MYLAPVLIGIVYAALNSLIRAEHRRAVNAVILAGAGAAYLSGGGFGPWQLVSTAVMTYVAYRGLNCWRWIGVGWLLHTGWDIAHYLTGHPILPFAHNSSLGCAICDPVIAVWCFRGGPSAPSLLRRQPRPTRPAAPVAGAPSPALRDPPRGEPPRTRCGPRVAPPAAARRSGRRSPPQRRRQCVPRAAAPANAAATATVRLRVSSRTPDVVRLLTRPEVMLG